MKEVNSNEFCASAHKKAHMGEPLEQKINAAIGANLYDYDWFIKYHKRGDAGVEERMIAKLSAYFRLSRWDSFRLVYHYATTYSTPSALTLMRNPKTPKNELKFRTDRRYVRIGNTFDYIMQNLNPGMLAQLDEAQTTTEQYNTVASWFYFGRYAAFLFLEVWAKISGKQVIDDLALKFERKESYTRGAEIIARTQNGEKLTQFIESAKRDTGDNVFSLKTSLCAVEKFRKGSRWDGYYTERMINDAVGTRWEEVILKLI